MWSQKFKQAFYFIASPSMRISGFFYRYLRFPREGNIRVQFGPGQSNYLDEWINIDANIFSGKADVWADLRNPLPLHDDSVDAAYSHHVIEHLPNIGFHFSEVYRCLKSGGVYRIGVPNGDSAIAKFIEKDKEWFDDFPDRRDSIGGRFENFIFCRQEHLTILTYSYLEELVIKAGFINCRQCKPVKESNYPEIFEKCLLKEYERDYDMPHTLVIEIIKP